jgi:protein KRI1
MIFQSFSDNEVDENTIVIPPSQPTEVKPKPAETVTSQTAISSQTAETSNIEPTNKKKKKKNKKVSEQNGGTSANEAEAIKTESAASPGKFVKAAENTEKMSSSNTKATNQKTNKRKFNDDDNKKSGPNNHKKMKFNKNGGKKFNNNQAASNELSENRLKAFGINPKKFKNKIKYSNKNDGGKNTHSKKPFHNKKTTS